jgi:hypothetical protein
MHRRDVLKALATLPLGTALGGCKEKNDNKQPSNIVEVHLDGAFALVIQENKANAILAFSPRPKKGDEPHQFFFNGSPKPEDPEKAFHFKLALERHKRDSQPEISPGLKDFSFKTDRWRVGDSLSLFLPIIGHHLCRQTIFWNTISKIQCLQSLSVVNQA